MKKKSIFAEQNFAARIDNVEGLPHFTYRHIALVWIMTAVAQQIRMPVPVFDEPMIREMRGLVAKPVIVVPMDISTFHRNVYLILRRRIEWRFPLFGTALVYKNLSLPEIMHALIQPDAKWFENAFPNSLPYFVDRAVAPKGFDFDVLRSSCDVIPVLRNLAHWAAQFAGPNPVLIDEPMPASRRNTKGRKTE